MIKSIIPSDMIVYVLLSLYAVFTPIQHLLLVVGFLVVCDFVFALRKAYVLNESITSRKMSNTISKLFLYTLTVIAVFLLEKYVIESSIPITKIVGGLISLVEIKSCDETFKSLFGYSFWDKARLLMKRGTSSTKDLLDSFEEEEKKEDDKTNP
jgi:hypothetical protein